MKKSKKPELKKVEEVIEADPVERLKVGTHGAEGNDQLVVDFEEDKALGKDLEKLLAEEKMVQDDEIDKLFSEEKKNRHDDVEVEVRKALYQPKSSQASIQRGTKSAEATKRTREEEIASYKSLEDAWDGQIEENEKHSKPVLVVGVICLGLIITAGAWALIKVSKDDQIAHKSVLEEREQISKENKKKAETATEGIRKVEAVLMKYVNAKTIDERMGLLYESERLKKEIEAFYADPKNQENMDNVVIERVVEELVMGKKVWSIIFSHGPIGDKKQSFYFFRKDASGDYKIDWETIASHQRFDWKTFVKQRSTTPIEVRAVVIPSIQNGQYNWGFTDDEYYAYRLTLNDDKVFWGYIHKDNKFVIKQMNEIVATTIAYQRIYPELKMQLILAIKFKEDTHEYNDQCVEITKIISPHWVDLRDAKNKVESKPLENSQ